jgi:transglutaminase-like putative cysteine protease
MTYDLCHTTTYDYTGPVSLSHHTLRLHPRDLERQTCLESKIEILPEPSVKKSHVDYFGNEMTFLTVEGAHRSLVITSRSQVKVEVFTPPKPQDTPAWEKVRDFCQVEEANESLKAREFLYPSPHVKRLPEFADYARPSFAPNRPILEAVLDLTARIYCEFKFDPKATSIATPLDRVLKQRRGVCQDFAHLAIAFMRAMGIPARYVSGYLETDPPPGKARLAGADASHAWASFHCQGLGWIDVDPTNNLLPSNRHITVAWGRDYSDVSPIRGVILGSGEHTLKVAVDVIPVHEPRLPFEAAKIT